MAAHSLPELQTNTELSKEPSLGVGAASTSIIGAIYIIFEFIFPNIPDGVVGAIMTIIAIAGPFLVSWVIRSKVWSPYSAQKAVNEAVVDAIKATTKTKEMLRGDNLKLISIDNDPEESTKKN